MLDRATDAYKLWHGFLKDVPKVSRYSLGTAIDTRFIITVELILRSGYAARSAKPALVERASSELDVLKFLLQVAWELKVLDNKKYTRISEPLDEVGRMLGGWRKQLATTKK